MGYLTRVAALHKASKSLEAIAVSAPAFTATAVSAICWAQMSILVAAALCLLTSDVTPAHRLRWSTESNVTCPNRAALASALAARFDADSVAPGMPGPSEAGLSVAARGQDLELFLRDGDGRLTRRRVARDGTCQDLAETIALLAEGWLIQLPWRGEGIVRLQPPAPLAEGDVPAAQPAPDSARPKAAATKPPRPTRVQSRTPGIALAAATQVSPAARSPTAALSLRLSAGGLFPSDAAHLSAQGALAAEVSLPHRFGVGASGALLTDLNASDPLFAPGHLVIHGQRFTGFGSYRPLGWLELLLGAQLLRLDAQSQGYTSPVHHTVLDAALWGSALAQLRLPGPVFLFGQAAIGIEPREAFQVTDFGHPETLLALPNAFLELSGGLGVSL